MLLIDQMQVWRAILKMHRDQPIGRWIDIVAPRVNLRVGEYHFLPLRFQVIAIKPVRFIRKHGLKNYFGRVPGSAGMISFLAAAWNPARE